MNPQVRPGMADEATQDGRIPVVITVDTEPDNAWDWHLDPSVANLPELSRFQELLSKYGAGLQSLPMSPTR